MNDRYRGKITINGTVQLGAQRNSTFFTGSSTDQLNQIQDSTKKAEEVSDDVQLAISNLSNLDFPLDKFNNINKQLAEVGASLESSNGSISGSANKVNAIAESLSVVSEITEKISLFKLKVDELNKAEAKYNLVSYTVASFT